MRLALALAFSLAFPIESGAAAHCFSVWRYPQAQRCGTNRPPVVRIPLRRMASMKAVPVLPPLPGPPDIPLPDPDPATTALRALLR
jgi:hypothetical protein